MMSLNCFPVGLEMDVSYPNFQVSLTLLSTSQLKFEIGEGPFARIETVDIQVIPLGNGIFAVSWQEKDGATVTNVQDYDRGVIHSLATLPDGQFLRMTGTVSINRPADRIADDRSHRNKALVVDAMISLFQRHDTSAAELNGRRARRDPFFAYVRGCTEGPERPFRDPDLASPAVRLRGCGALFRTSRQGRVARAEGPKLNGEREI